MIWEIFLLFSPNPQQEQKTKPKKEKKKINRKSLIFIKRKAMLSTADSILDLWPILNFLQETFGFKSFKTTLILLT